MDQKIAIFAGNSCVKEKEDYYLGLAHKTGKLLAENGLVVITGAGEGLMNAALKGAKEGGGKTIGIGLNFGTRHQSEFIDDHTLYDKLGPRQEKLIDMGDAYIALPGGIGTFYEILNILALKRLNEIPAGKPLVLIDGYYNAIKGIIDEMLKDGFVEDSIYSLFDFASTPEEAVEIIKKKM